MIDAKNELRDAFRDLHGEMSEAFVAAANVEAESVVVTGGPGWVVTTEQVAPEFSPFWTETNPFRVIEPDICPEPFVSSSVAVTEADRLRRLIDDKVAADEEDRKAEAAYTEARKRLDNAMRKAKACHQELAKALGFSVKSEEKVKPTQPPRKKKRKDRSPLVPYKSTLSGRERMIVILGIRSTTRKGLENVARQMGCGIVSSGLVADDTFQKDNGDYWMLTGKGRMEFSRLIATDDGKKFKKDAQGLIFGGPGLEPAEVTVEGDKFSGMTTGDMAVILLGQGGLRQRVFDRVLESVSGRKARAILYSGSKAFFAKTGDLWGLSEFGKARLKVLMATPDGQAFRKVVQDAIGQSK